jgi:hypothetical protein
VVVPTLKQLQLQCLNVECGHTAGVDIIMTHTIVPSARPNPSVQLRMAPPRPRLTPANDDGPFGARAPEVAPIQAANDDDSHGEAVAIGG